jgi:hypothetical protein
MAEELLKKIPAETRWEINAKIMSTLFVIRGEKIVAPALGKGEGIISHLWGADKWKEIHVKIFGDAGRQLMSWFKEMFNIPVEDAIGAAKLANVAATLLQGPEWNFEIVEATPERVVNRITKCVWMERYREFGVDPAFIPCVSGCPAWHQQGFNATIPKLACKTIKQMPKGDPFCEYIYEFAEE